MAVFVFREEFPSLKKLAFFFSILGILILFNPLTFDWNNQSALIGSGFLLLASIASTVGTLFIRYSQWPSSPLELLPWQILVSTLFFLIASVIFEPERKIEWNGPFISLLFYEGIVATAFIYWAIIKVTRSLPAITFSLSMLAIPLIGMGSSAWYLEEPITLGLACAYLLLTAGILFTLVADRRINYNTALNKL
jgi:drug/metabolite transporter (DMT)-like permease